MTLNALFPTSLSADVMLVFVAEFSSLPMNISAVTFDGFRYTIVATDTMPSANKVSWLLLQLLPSVADEREALVDCMQIRNQACRSPA
jgi:hypothetical protein